MSTKKNKPKIIAIVGPTSSGKSDFAVEIALKINKSKKKLGISGVEIISADSRQVYKGFNLSSGKITKKEMCNIPHHMLDIASPKKTLSVVQFDNKAKKIIDKLHKENKIPIICGGTGFWIDSLIYGYSFPNVPPNQALRKKLKTLSTEKLFHALKKIDPERALHIDKNNKVRLIRAIEITNKIGKVPKLKISHKYNSLVIGLRTDKSKLNKRIEKRIEERIRKKMIKEIENIHKQGISYNRLKLFGLEFKWISRFLLKEITLEEMKLGLYTETIQYAKRQMTWFKRNKNIYWIKKPQVSSIWKKLTEFI